MSMGLSRSPREASYSRTAGHECPARYAWLHNCDLAPGRDFCGPQPILLDHAPRLLVPLAHVLVILKPETVVDWHRAGFAPTGGGDRGLVAGRRSPRRFAC
jgi:hypothetical protein